MQAAPGGLGSSSVLTPHGQAKFLGMSLAARDVSPEVAELQAQRYRAMSAAEKLAQADALWRLARELTKAGVRMRNPRATEAEVESATRALFVRAADDLISLFASRFRALGVEWMVAGGVAAIVFGEPRLTQDLDVVVALRPNEAHLVSEQWQEMLELGD